MITNHQFFFKNSCDMSEIPSGTVGLVVTSPPYPMIAMWDDMFASQSRYIAEALKKNDRLNAFELMNRELDKVWDEVNRVLIPGGFACINIGDATRTIDGHFMLYPNHSRILAHMMRIGMTPLPEIIWRKQSNAPNKFMGSGMLPAGAYVTQEHEYILILRKGGKRVLAHEDEKIHRRESAYFWEERNNLFSDVWTDLLGTRQKMEDKEVRKRSAAYPFELPYRLINMYSLKGDTVLDPFFGIGTTMLAAMTAGRNSLGYELSSEFKETIVSRTRDIIQISKDQINTRLEKHTDFVHERFNSGKNFRHLNKHYHFPIITAQEKELILNEPVSIDETGENTFELKYLESAQEEISSKWNGFELPEDTKKIKEKPSVRKKDKKPVQTSFFKI